MKPEAPGEPRQTSDIVQFAGFVLKEGGRRSVFALGFLFLGSLTEGISILLLVPVLHLVGPGRDAITLNVPGFLTGLLGTEISIGLLPVLVCLVVLVLAQALLLRFKSTYMAELLYDFINHLRVSLFESIGRARWRFVARIRGSDLQHVLTADIDRIQNAAFHLLLLIQGSVLLAVYLVVSAAISPAVTLLAFVAGGALLALLRPIRLRASRYGRLLTENRREQYRTVYEFLTGMKVAKSFNAEPRYVAELAATLRRMRHEFARFLRLSSIGSVLFQTASAIVLATFVYIALEQLHLDLAQIVVLVFLFMRVLPRFSALQTDMQEILVNLPAFGAMRKMQAACDREREEPSAPLATAPVLKQEIRFESVSFRFVDEAAKILDGASFRIPARQITALIGPSGSGKSTIADLLMGLLEPGAGRVTIDDLGLEEGNRRSWRDSVAYVPQEVFLLHDTIAANLRLAVPEASESDLWEALGAAHADAFVARLPDRLQTVVGDRGAQLSGGERQRIALARALLRRPQLLILDEATSALDWENQALIARSIRELRGSMTILTIAHRLSMITFADWIVAISGGRIEETGPYDELIRVAGSRLARLVAGEQGDGRDPVDQPVETASLVARG